MKKTGKYFEVSTVAELKELAKEPVDVKLLNDIQVLHHLRNESGKILFENKKISKSVKKQILFIQELINNEMDRVRKLR